MPRKTDNHHKTGPVPAKISRGKKPPSYQALPDKIDELLDFYDFSPVGYLTLDPEGLFLAVNLTATIMFDIPRSKLLGQSFYEYVVREDRDILYLHLRKLFKEKKSQVCELRIQSRTDKIIHVTLQSIYDEDRKGRRVCRSVAADITSRVLAEQTIQDREERLKLVIDGAALGVSDINLITGQVTWNRRLYELLGRDPDGPAITGRTFFKYIHKADLYRVRKHVKEIIQKGTKFRDEFRIVNDDGKVRWLGAAGQVYRDETGRPVRMSDTSFDITQRKQAEDALYQSEERFCTLNETIPTGVGVSSADGVFLYTNPAYELILGYNHGELLGKKASELYVNPDNRTSLLMTMQKGGVVKDVEIQLKKKDGTPIWVSINASNINYGGKKAVIGTIQDITERKLADEALQRVRDELEMRVQKRTVELADLNEALRREIEKRKKFESHLRVQGQKILAAYEQRDYLSRRLVDLLEKERGEIANALHDEIGQMMAVIDMKLELLKQDASSLADRVEPIQKQLRETVRCARGICSNLRSDVLEHFGLIPSIKELVDRTQEQFPIKVHLFTKNVPERFKERAKNLTVYRLTQEALTNIHKHAEAKEVFINLIGRDGMLSLTIEDDGVGFDYDDIKTRRALSLSHLGITIMRERVSMVGGTFKIKSALGKGAQIFVKIPIESADDQEVQN